MNPVPHTHRFARSKASSQAAACGNAYAKQLGDFVAPGERGAARGRSPCAAITAQFPAKQARIAALVSAIASLTALMTHELMMLDFVGALVVVLILIDLNNQLARLQ